MIVFRRMLCLIAVLIALASCSGGDSDGASPDPGSMTPGPPALTRANDKLIAGSRVATNAPNTFKSRGELADCGEIILRHGEKLPPSAVTCIETAKGEGAELVAIVPTIDDGFYVVYYRGGGTFDGLEVFTDGSRSPFGAFWQHEKCTTLSSLRTMSSGSDCTLVEQTG
ncbi:hypothetical protein BH09ACT10_BH09ACT10_22220 [soil metagenome]